MLKVFYKNLLFITLACCAGTTNPTPTELKACPNVSQELSTREAGSEMLAPRVDPSDRNVGVGKLESRNFKPCLQGDTISLKECLICACKKSISNFEHSCCEVGKQTCNACVAHMNNLEEMSDEDGHAHPESLRYSLDANEEECEKIDQAENATPESQPTWTWQELNGHWYFLENNTWWRYESENGEKSRVADGWRYIPVARCACGKIHNHLLHHHNPQ